MKDLTATIITQDLYRVDLHGAFIEHGTDPIAQPKREGRVVAMIDKKRLQAMHDEIGEVLAGRPTPKPKPKTADFKPEDLV